MFVAQGTCSSGFLSTMRQRCTENHRWRSQARACSPDALIFNHTGPSPNSLEAQQGKTLEKGQVPSLIPSFTSASTMSLGHNTMTRTTHENPFFRNRKGVSCNTAHLAHSIKWGDKNYLIKPVRPNTWDFVYVSILMSSHLGSNSNFLMKCPSAQRQTRQGTPCTGFQTAAGCFSENPRLSAGTHLNQGLPGLDIQETIWPQQNTSNKQLDSYN